MKRPLILSSLFVSVALLFPEVSYGSQNDQLIALAVENQLITAGAESVRSASVDVSAADGVVTLSGTVDNLLAREHAARLTKQVKGVIAVSNQIVVVPPEKTDRKIKIDLYDALRYDPATLSTGLDIEVANGKAILKGALDSAAEKKLALLVARSVAGVREIKDLVVVMPRRERIDEEVKAEIERLLDFSAALDDVEVKVAVKEGAVSITGSVGTDFQRSKLEEIAAVDGVNSVDVNGVDIDWSGRSGTLRKKRFDAVTDATIAENVQLALKQDPFTLVFAESIVPASKGGVVTLTGKVATALAKDKAAQVATGVVGVFRVDNRLKVVWPKQASDTDINNYVSKAMARDAYLHDQEVIVRTRNAHVNLYGLVDTKFDFQRAAFIASAQPGVVHVANYLTALKTWEPKSDDEIAESIRNSLTFVFPAPSNNIQVTVENGVAILRGTVDTWLHWQTAMDIAVDAGARKPHSLLKIRYRPQHTTPPHIYVP
ncbi:MAG: osmotically-inducible protein OsmY [Verrucomicrobiales bacterium]|jgi:osmotically-inducible protein OsmY